MGKGNIYLVIPRARYNDPLPNKVKKNYEFNRAILDGNGDPVLDGNQEPTFETVHPTWKEVGKKRRRQFGRPVTVEFDGSKYILMELEFSYLDGEVADLLKLKKNKQFPKYRLLNRKEARRFVRGQLDATAETGN